MLRSSFPFVTATQHTSTQTPLNDHVNITVFFCTSGDQQNILWCTKSVLELSYFGCFKIKKFFKLIKEIKENNPDRPLPSWSPEQPPGSLFHHTSSPWAQAQLNTLKMVTNTHVSLARQSMYHLVILFFLVLWFVNYSSSDQGYVQKLPVNIDYQRSGWATTLLPTVSLVFGALG